MATSDIFTLPPTQSGAGSVPEVGRGNGNSIDPSSGYDEFSSLLIGDRGKPFLNANHPADSGKARGTGDVISSVSVNSSGQLTEAPLLATALTVQSDVGPEAAPQSEDPLFPGLHGIQIAAAHANPSEHSRISKELGDEALAVDAEAGAQGPAQSSAVNVDEEVDLDGEGDETGADLIEEQDSSTTAKLAETLVATLAVPSPAKPTEESGTSQNSLTSRLDGKGGTPNEAGNSISANAGNDSGANSNGQSGRNGNAQGGGGESSVAPGTQANASASQLPDPAFPFQSSAEAQVRSESSSDAIPANVKDAHQNSNSALSKLETSLPDALERRINNAIQAGNIREHGGKESGPQTSGNQNVAANQEVPEAATSSKVRAPDIAKLFADSAATRLEQAIFGQPTTGGQSAPIVMPAIAPALPATIIPDSAVAGRAISTLSPQISAHAIEHVAVQISRAVDAGKSTFTVRMDPPELGRLDVRLEFLNDGNLRAHVSAESRETLDLLSRDSRGLERALQDAGIKTDSGSLQFSLRQNGEELAQKNAGDGGKSPENRDGLSDEATTKDEVILNAHVADSAGALDIRV